METAAVTATGLIGVVVLFQIGLMAGAPWGRAAWGGQHPGRLPTRLRLGSAVATLLLALLAWVVLAAARLIPISPIPEPWLEAATWLGAAYFGLGAGLNLISRSRVERLWAPVALLTGICFGIVAAG